jgi:hypothetical protein
MELADAKGTLVDAGRVPMAGDVAEDRMGIGEPGMGADLGAWEAEVVAIDQLANDPSCGHDDHFREVARLHQRAEAELGSDHKVTVALFAEAAAFAARAPLTRRPGNGPRFPDQLPPATTSPGGLDALAARMATTSSARVRARLADVLWESASKAHRPPAALAAPAAYLELARLLRRAPRDPGRDLEIADALRRSAELGLATGQNEVADAAVAETIDCLEGALTDRALGAVIEMATTLDGFRPQLGQTQVEMVLKRLQTAMELWREQDRVAPPFPLAELHEVRRRLLLTLRREQDAYAEDLAAAADFAEFAERVGSALLAQGYLESAISYAERGQADRQVLNGYRSRLRRALKAGIAEMKPIVASGTLPAPLAEALEGQRQMLARLPLSEVIGYLAGGFLVTPDQCAKMAGWAAANTPLTASFPHTVISGPGSTVGPGRDQAHLFDIGRLMLAASDGRLVFIWADLRSRTEVMPADVVAHLVGVGAIPEDRASLITVGLERAWAEDYASALHILVPQLEEALRRLLEKSGHDPMRRRPADPQVTEEIPLSSIIQGLVDAGVMTTDEAWLFNLVLDEPAGLNLRNRIAHGLMALGDLTPERFARVLHLYCIATSVAQRASEGREGSPPGPRPEEAG